MTHVDQAIASLATRQHGVFSRAQAVACGANRNLVARRVRDGAWAEVTGLVLRIAGAPVSDTGRLLAAILHVGHGAAASHRAAAALFGLPGFDLDVHVTRPRGRHWRTPPYGIVHEKPLDGGATVVDGIPVTTVARTLLDVAASEHPRRVERALDNALAMRLTSVASLAMPVRTSRGRTGVRLLRSLVEARSGGGYVPPESELEARFLALVRQAGLPEPELQVFVGGDAPAGRADMVWRAAQVVVELDSRRHHSALLDAKEDVRRDVAAAHGGWRVLRVTWEDVFAFPDRTLVRLAAALDDAAMRLRAG